MRRANVARQHPVLEPLDAGQSVRRDLVEAPQVPGERVRLGLDRRAAQILEQIIVRVDAVEGRMGGMRLVQIAEQIVDEVRQRFGNGHSSHNSDSEDRLDSHLTATIRQWYNKRPGFMPGTLFVVATPIGNLEDISARALRVLREATLIAAEDTRRTAQLLSRFAITTPTTSLHEHNESRKSAALVERLQQRRLDCPGFGRGHADDF